MLTPLVNNFYYDNHVKDLLVAALLQTINDLKGEPVFLCIGSEQHILDCFGPLIGTMVLEKAPDILLYGTLDMPLHAKNLVQKIEEIKNNHPEIITIAIDAAVGLEEDIGLIKFRTAPLLPGKALSKRLPAVGDLSITGIVTKKDLIKGSSFKGSLYHVYNMAKIVSQAIYEWSQLDKRI